MCMGIIALYDFFMTKFYYKMLILKCKTQAHETAQRCFQLKYSSTCSI